MDRYRNRWIGEFLKEMMSAPILQLPCSSIRILCDLRRLTDRINDRDMDNSKAVGRKPC